MAKIVIACCVCDKIRNKEGYFVSEKPAENVILSHGFCPTCLKKYYEEYGMLEELEEQKKRVNIASSLI